MEGTSTSTSTSTGGGSSGGSPPGGGGPGGGGGGGPGGPGGPGGAGAAAPIRFARTPGEIDADNLIDYSTKEGKIAFKTAIAALGETKYDGKSAGINSFHEKLMRRAKDCGWDVGMGDIININGINSVTHYGRLTSDQIRVQATTYVDDASRKTQNNAQMYRAIMNSITEECSNKIINRPSEYTIRVGMQDHVSVILLHKALMQKAIVDTRSTSSNF